MYVVDASCMELCMIEGSEARPNTRYGHPYTLPRIYSITLLAAGAWGAVVLIGLIAWSAVT